MDPNTPALAGSTLRQVVHTSVGGRVLRVRLSNAFGRSELGIAAAEVALSTDGSAISTGAPVPLSFSGRPGIVVPPGAVAYSDPVEFPLRPLADVAVTLRLDAAPDGISSHPGARATTWWRKEPEDPAQGWSTARHVDRWYFLTGIEVETSSPPRAVVLLGDSITDGHGVKPGTNTRWPDELARRLQAQRSTSDIGVLNQGVGGNRLLRNSFGQNVQARFERDVLAQAGVRWVVLLAGINDLGLRPQSRRKGEPFASESDIIGAYEQILARAEAAGLVVYGATLTPYAGAKAFWSEDGEADRQSINRWIRESGRFAAVIDFDLALRDPENPSRLAPRFDSGDHIHPSVAGYAEMARVVDLGLFAQGAARRKPDVIGPKR